MNTSSPQLFQLTITHSSRVLAAILLLPVLLACAAVIWSSIHAIAGIVFVILTGYVLKYFLFSPLEVADDHGLLIFEWQKKLIFNQKPFPSIHQKDVVQLLVDRDQFIRTIVTPYDSIHLNTSPYQSKDAVAFIAYCCTFTQIENVKYNLGWGSLSVSTLRVMLYVTRAIILASLMFILFLLIDSGFHFKLLFLFGPICSLFYYHQKLQQSIRSKRHTSNDKF